MTMSDPTDKASVAIDEIEARHNYLTDKVEAGYQFGCMNGYHAHEDRRRLLAEVKRLRALSPAQGDRMRDALLNLIALARPHFSDETQMLALKEAEAALASHPDRQPGMTDEEAESLLRDE